MCVQTSFSFNFLGDLETRELSSTNNCREHGKPLKYFCSSCNISICKTCWRNDHGDINHHQIKLFEFVLEPEKHICDRIKDYREQTTQCVNKFNSVFEQFVKEVCNLEERQIQVMKSRNNEELMNKRQVVREMVATQTKTVIAIQAELNEECERIREKVTNLLPSNGDKEKKENIRGQTDSSETLKERSETVTSQIMIGRRRRRNLKSVKAKFKCEESFDCRRAVYNWSTQQVICFGRAPNAVLILDMKSEKNSLTVGGRVEWEGERGDESLLCSIAMTSDNTLYASVLNRRNKRWRVSVLRQESDWREEREIDTSLISREQHQQRADSRGFRYYYNSFHWALRGCGNRMAIVTMSVSGNDRKCRWECVYIYREEKCIHRVRLDIERDSMTSSVCYIGSHLLLRTRGNRVAVVALEAGNNIRGKEEKERQKTSRETMNGDEENYCDNSNLQNKRREKEKDCESGEIEESKASDIKYITLQDNNLICGLVWVRGNKDNDENEMEQGGSMMHTTTNCDGYLFVGDGNFSGIGKCSVYEIDMDRVKDGDRLNSRKDLEIDAMLPMCIIDNSDFFAIQFNPSNEQNPVILTLEFS